MVSTSAAPVDHPSVPRPRSLLWRKSSGLPPGELFAGTEAALKEAKRNPIRVQASGSLSGSNLPYVAPLIVAAQEASQDEQ